MVVPARPNFQNAITAIDLGRNSAEDLVGSYPPEFHYQLLFNVADLIFFA